jgi:hypothetical protein
VAEDQVGGYDIIIRAEMPVPGLTLEGDRPGKIDSTTSLRLETFIEMLRGIKYILFFNNQPPLPAICSIPWS